MKELTQELFDSNLDSAIENHYDDIRDWPVDDIAIELLCFADDFEETDVELDTRERMYPFIEDWKRRNPVPECAAVEVEA